MTLSQEAIYRPFCEVVELSIFNRMIAVGDIMKGPALVEYIPKADKEAKDAKKTGLIEHAITFLKFFTSSIQLLDENTILASDCDKLAFVPDKFATDLSSPDVYKSGFIFTNKSPFFTT